MTSSRARRLLFWIASAGALASLCLGIVDYFAPDAVGGVFGDPRLGGLLIMAASVAVCVVAFYLKDDES